MFEHFLVIGFYIGALCLIDFGQSAVPSTSIGNNLTGHFKSPSGDVIVMTCTGTSAAAELSGTFLSASAMASYSLTGRATTCDSDAQLAFSVAWSNTQSGNEFSAQSWVAQAILSDDRDTILQAMWVNVRETDSGSTWRAMTSGTDSFQLLPRDSTNTIIRGTTPTIS